MKNVYLILLDSLRADHVFGNKKSSITPNLDLLVSQGINFINAFSVSDHTGVSWLAIINALFPTNSKINPYKFDSSIKTFIEIFKANNYQTFCFFPDISFFKILSEKFDDSIIYEYSERVQYLKNKEKRFQQLKQVIKSQNTSDPCLNCIHLMDLKYPYTIPDEFNNDNFGKDRQDRRLSSLDKILGDLFQCIDMDNSIVILSSDHGDYVPVTDHHSLSEIPKIQNIMRKGKKFFPRLEPTGVKMFEIMKKTTGDIKKKNLEKKLSESELRGFSDRNQDVLFDEVIHVPLIFSGKDCPKMEISNLVRHVDVFPTISSMVGLSYGEYDFDGKNLVPIIKGSKTNELTAYIESGPANENLVGKVVGLRSLLYKYFRSRSNPNETVHLYDLKQDPLELQNIANANPQIVENMETQLQNLKDGHDKKIDQITTKDRKEIEDELRKLGYI